MENYAIQFKKMNEQDLTLLHQWFHIPHVLKWYARGELYTLDKIRKKYLPRINDLSIQNFIIYDHQKPVGYIQLYHLARHLPEGVIDYSHPLFNDLKPSELVGIDLFIADESYLRKGFASRALKLFVENYVRGKFKAILVDPLKQNKVAIAFFEQNGFRSTLSQDDNYDLMIKPILDNEYAIAYGPNPRQDETKILWKGISEHAKLARELKAGKPFAFFIKDKANQIKGGCSGYLFYGCLYVDLLWIDKLLRERYYGTKLMQAAEKLARENNCHFMTVSTMDFEALDFYKKLGFWVEFRRSGFDKNSSMYFLRKDL